MANWKTCLPGHFIRYCATSFIYTALICFPPYAVVENQHNAGKRFLVNSRHNDGDDGDVT